MLNEVLDKIKRAIGIEEFDNNNKILIDTDDKLPTDITLKDVILIICAIKDDGKYYPHIFLFLSWTDICFD